MCIRDSVGAGPEVVGVVSEGGEVHEGNEGNEGKEGVTSGVQAGWMKASEKKVSFSKVVIKGHIKIERRVLAADGHISLHQIADEGGGH